MVILLSDILSQHSSSSISSACSSEKDQADLSKQFSFPSPLSAPIKPARTIVSSRQSVLMRRKAFLKALRKPSTKPGYVMCRLCSQLWWGPNGRYHMEKCSVITSARKKAAEDGLLLTCIAGLPIDEDLFKQPKKVQPKMAKIEGFAVSSSVSIADPTRGPTEEERRQGLVGKKGQVRCLKCNVEVHAPNSRHHRAICHRVFGSL